MAGLVCGVDVGTGSARAGIFDRHGVLLGRSERPIALYREQGDRGEHAADEIWVAVGAAIRGALAASGATPADVAGLSFDATCSLVVRGSGGAPLALTEGPPPRDTIAWFDHRAIAEAEEFTATVHPVLDHLGGAMSPEMQLPKLMWLKRRRPDLWRRAVFLFDLADFLTWKATGSLARSQCTLVAKWTYLAHAGGWQRDLLARIGLDDLLQRGALPEGAVPAGTDLGPLTPSAASDLGLTTRCRVGAGLVDAFAGALGMLGPLGHRPGVAWPPEDSLALIGGTSSCLMSLSREPRRMPGGWGPYFGAVLPGTWMTEAGQTATGALLDHLLRWHAAGGEPEAALHGRVAARIAALRAEEGPDLAPRLHVLPDFLGNRAPLADPHAQGVISGLTLDVSFDSLCRLYFRSCVAIALGVRRDSRDAGRIRQWPAQPPHDRRPHAKPAADGALCGRHRLQPRRAGGRRRRPARHGDGGGRRRRASPRPSIGGARHGSGDAAAPPRPRGPASPRSRLCGVSGNAAPASPAGRIVSRYFPVKRGARFSRKAATPSR